MEDEQCKTDWIHSCFHFYNLPYTYFEFPLAPKRKQNIYFRLQVPHTTFLLTQVCFLFYHGVSNITLRKLQHATAELPEKIQWLFKAGWILVLSYFIAYLETVAISNVCAYIYLANLAFFHPKVVFDFALYILSGQWNIL